MFRKLLGAPLRLADLADVHPDVHRSLQTLLSYPADRVEADMGLSFQVRAAPLRVPSGVEVQSRCTSSAPPLRAHPASALHSQHAPTAALVSRRARRFAASPRESVGCLPHPPALPCRALQVSHEVDFEVSEHELRPHGAEVAVSAANREAFVREYVRFLLVERVAPQFEAFERGFFRVCDRNMMRMFASCPSELEEVVCGCVPSTRPCALPASATGSDVPVRLVAATDAWKPQPPCELDHAQHAQRFQGAHAVHRPALLLTPCRSARLACACSALWRLSIFQACLCTRSRVMMRCV